LFQDLKQEAEGELVAAAKLDPEEAFIHLRLGELWGAKEKWAEAVEALKKAEDLAPFEAVTHAALDETFCLMGKRATAMAELKKAERFDTGTDVGLNLALAEAYALLDEVPLAVKNYRTFIKGADHVGCNPL